MMHANGRQSLGLKPFTIPHATVRAFMYHNPIFYTIATSGLHARLRLHVHKLQTENPLKRGQERRDGD